MKLTVRYFAALRERIGRSEEVVDAPNSLGSVGELRHWLAQRGEPWTAAFEQTRRIRAAVDQAMVGDAHALHDGAEVAFFPPVTGG